MNYTKKITISLATLTLVLGSYSLCSANEVKPKSKPLILNIGTTVASEFSSTTNNSHTFENTSVTKHDSKVSKKIKRAKKLISKITSFRYNKKQKLKAHLGKSSYVLQYTHKL